MTFAPDDLHRIRVMPRPDPMWELTLSVHRLRPGQPNSAAQNSWSRQIEAVTGTESPSRDLLSLLIPPQGNFPDFLTPADSRDGFEAALDAVLDTPARQWQQELSGALESHTALPDWAPDLTSPGRSSRMLVDSALRDYFRRYVQPYWPGIQRHVAADFTTRSGHLAAGGTGALLARLSSRIRWDWPVLEADYPVDHEIDLRGRGLTLIPSFFCAGVPVTLADPDLEPVLVYPVTGVDIRPATVTPGDPRMRALAEVVGTTRAQILAALDDPCSTGVLATRVERSAASASEQVGLLRAAGLVHTSRRGQRVRHELTVMGRRLLHAPAAPPPSH
nr:helix-turn-helix domain-containing protein [Allosaccharopolyspora coralli]